MANGKPAASDTLMRDNGKSASRTIMGGLGGTVSTSDLERARVDFNKYQVDAQSNGDDALAFEDYVRQVWKPANGK